MLKLYKRINGEYNYFQASVINRFKGKVHWGVIGDYGKTHIERSRLFTSFRKVIQQVVYMKVADGYAEIPDEQHVFMAIRFDVDYANVHENIAKKNRFQKALDIFLEEVGIGHCEFYYMSQTQTFFCCLVVDFEIAKKVLAEHLQGTEFADYADIYIADPLDFE